MIVSVRNKQYFVCDYTGAPVTTRYFIPKGKNGKSKVGCYASLPILLRHQYELQGEQFNEEYEEIKKSVELFYNQPDIPMSKPLPLEVVPLSESELINYMNSIDTGMGTSWFLVPKGVAIEDALPKKRAPRKKAKIESEELTPTQLLE
jgi:hypothetical protein